MRIASTLLTIIASALSAAAGTLTFAGLNLEPVRITPAASTGISEVVVLPYTVGVTATFTPSTPGATVTWQRFSAMGGGYAEDVPSQGGTLTTLEGDMGYIVTEGTDMTCFWVVDYSRHHLRLRSLTPSPESDCSTTWLNLDAEGAYAIRYYSITGVPQTLSRELQLTYRTLTFDEAAFAYTETEQTTVLESAGTAVHTDAPFCATDFTLSGDRFLKAWGEEQSVTSDVVEPIAVEANTKATQTQREVDNEQSVEAELGGSAPCEITFEAALTDAAIYHMWQISSDPEFNLVTLQFPDTEFTHTFREQGTTYVRLTCANAAGDCEFYGDTYEVFIGESDIKCPNAFSPGNSEGVNDEWRVSYKSITRFECHIFNRWGQQLYHSTDPSRGWNGKAGGKVVPPGVYFYVITAEGADGRKYKLKGDINVVKGRRGSSSSDGSSSTN